ncbi:MAG: tetratricopeptide repeat protein [Acidobacteriota bacterium]|nr:tetratricopeptide repeat protein [Acidobacteriota bacterium]
MSARVPILIGLVVVSVVMAAPEDLDKLFEEATDLAAKGRVEKAVTIMEKIQSYEPDHPDVLWNLGLWYAELGRHRDALYVWKHYRIIRPGEWQARAKLIQAYQALGETEWRDAEREGLLAWYADLPDDLRPGRELFCREQFRVGERQIMAFEFFEPAGIKRVYLRFSILDGEGKESSWYSLGSYDATTEIARATGEIGEEERIYHLDHYAEDHHVAVRFFREMPSYETVREMVVAAIESASSSPED